LGDGGSDEEGSSGGGYSSSSMSTDPYSFGSNYSPYSPSKPRLYSYDFLSSYDKAANGLAASISASAAPASGRLVGGLTDYVGLSGSLVTPVGGAEVDVGFYSDSYGMLGSYFGLGPAMGLPGGSLGVVKGRTQSLAGESISVSAGLSYGVVGASKGNSIDPSTGEITGEQWSAGLSLGPKVAASGAYISTTTTEFTSLYLVYIQFLNWVGYPDNNAAGYPGYW
jgi:hypothetical protein